MKPQQTKHLLIALAAVLLLCASLAYKTYDDYWGEIEWYTESLGYDFSARVDSTVSFHENGNGFLYISVTEGSPELHREDSLDQHLRHYRRLRFLRTSDGALRIFTGSADAFFAGDSIYVNSGRYEFLIFRDGELLRKFDLRDYLSKRYF